MRTKSLRLGAGACLWALLASPLLPAGGVTGQEARIASGSVTLSSGGRAELEIELADGTEHRLAFVDGAVRVDGRQVGAYEIDGTLASAWRDFLREQAGADGLALEAGLGRLLDDLAEWATELAGAEAEAARSLRASLGPMLGVEVAADVAEAGEETPAIAGQAGDLAIAPGGISFQTLIPELQRLEGALDRLGEAARGAGDRLALIVHDDYAIPAGRTIAGNLALLDGDLRLSGTVAGDVLILDGALVLEPGARIDGDVLQAGGEFDPGAGAVAGEILADIALGTATAGPPATVGAPAPVVRPDRPDRPTRRTRPGRRGFFDRLSYNVGHAAEGLASTLSAFIGLALLGMLLVYFSRGRLETVADTVRHDFARSFAMGLAGQILFVPAVVIMAVLVILIPVIPFFVLGTILAVMAGFVAVAHGAGEIFAQRRYGYEWLQRLRRSNSYYYVLSGLVLLLLPFALIAMLWVFGGALGFLRGIATFAACVGTWILLTAGFGGVLLTRGGSRSVVVEWAASPAPPPSADAGEPAGGRAETFEVEVEETAGDSEGEAGDDEDSEGTRGGPRGHPGQRE